jgi:hypothetical protein
VFMCISLMSGSAVTGAMTLAASRWARPVP